MTSRSYLTEDDLGLDETAIRRSFARHVELTQGKDEFSATARDFFTSLALTVRDRLCDRWNKTQKEYYRLGARRVYFLSLEYLLGRQLIDSLLSLGIYDEACAALFDLGIDLAEVAAQEDDPGLGNGGLGRLSACFLESMATLGIAATGYGVRYKYGIFRQEIVGGAQVEQPDNWLRYGTPWEITRPERLYMVQFGGRVDTQVDDQGRLSFLWIDTSNVMAMANDMPVPGYRNGVVNTLRLFSAHATRELDVAVFNQGDYFRAVQEKDASENLTRVLYPNDHVVQGIEMRLKQEYFFVSATLQDAVHRHQRQHESITSLADYAVFQLNDTHPALAVAELMRLLIDEHRLEWDVAWGLTTRCFAFTNHAVASEALQAWPVSLFERVLPRHLQIIFEINRRFIDEVRGRYPNDDERVRRLSLIEEGPPKRVRMAHLAIVGSFSVNGVSLQHTGFLRRSLFADFAELWPDRFLNVTNGVTPRRWLNTCNPLLANLITATIGSGWVTDACKLEALAPYADDPAFRARFSDAKRQNKERLAAYVRERLGVPLDVEALFDVHVKPIHENKRQLLALLSAIALYQGIKAKTLELPVSRVILFAGKAAPGNETAKHIIRLIHGVAEVVNRDPDVGGRLRVVFVPNYSVSLAELIIPAADLSEQTSLAGTEASGTGNMKLALNGALTIGSVDGANAEMLQTVGEDNMFVFGLTEAEVEKKRKEGYDPRLLYRRDRMLSEVLDAVASGTFSPDDPSRFRALIDSLIHHDRSFVLADFRAYRFCQQVVDATYLDREAWTRKAILNVASMGRFSSDASVSAYAKNVWRVPCGVVAGEPDAETGSEVGAITPASTLGDGTVPPPVSAGAPAEQVATVLRTVEDTLPVRDAAYADLLEGELVIPGLDELRSSGVTREVAAYALPSSRA